MLTGTKYTFFWKKIVYSLSIYVTFSVYRYYFRIFFTFFDKLFLFFSTLNQHQAVLVNIFQNLLLKIL